jgi:hypothetical protein
VKVKMMSRLTTKGSKGDQCALKGEDGSAKGEKVKVITDRRPFHGWPKGRTS